MLVFRGVTHLIERATNVQINLEKINTKVVFANIFQSFTPVLLCTEKLFWSIRGG